jgi:hypothetical protein
MYYAQVNDLCFGLPGLISTPAPGVYTKSPYIVRITII